MPKRNNKRGGYKRRGGNGQESSFPSIMYKSGNNFEWKSKDGSLPTMDDIKRFSRSTNMDVWTLVVNSKESYVGTKDGRIFKLKTIPGKEQVKEQVKEQEGKYLKEKLQNVESVVRNNKNDQDSVLLEKLKDAIQGLDFNSFSQFDLAKNYAVFGERFRPLVDIKIKPLSYKFLHENILNKMTQGMNELQTSKQFGGDNLFQKIHQKFFNQSKNLSNAGSNFLRKTANVQQMDLGRECKDNTCQQNILNECVILLDKIDSDKKTSKQMLDMFNTRPFSEVFNLCTRAAKTAAREKY